ncbi:MAG: heavy metal transporter [Bacteroidetes bacterium RIFCSPLOWO2_02_FULL_36_8]|nr:MAG: heavy metal transporter [Bacteroidetes bacterium RIFCSPLOWO2_02_FULL_36_8]OFY71120.1 MAG: heavy metal transporter [Bacteroidetes bacterium RIFCSPLOWO2_12_FULL_37_12]
MNTQKTSKGLVGAGILSALAASLCCITPLLALIAGTSGFASAFSWLEPARPYLMGVTVLVLGFAWYQKLKPKKAKINCACEVDEKPSFLQTKSFLGIVTVFAVLMLAFPNYSHVFYPKTESKVPTTVWIESGNVAETNFEIEGMTCQGCEEHIKNAVAQLPGFISAEANHEKGKATVKFDKSKTTTEQIVTAINETGYKVIKQEGVNL